MASRSWNRVELIGNLTKDPELRYTPNGAAVATFTVATNRTYVTDGEKREDVDYHRCVAWNKLAELCQQLLKKGNRVFVSGRLQNRSWEGTDGQNRQVTEIVVEDMLVLTSRQDFSASAEVGVSPPESEAPLPTQEDEKPKKEKQTKKPATIKDPDKETKEDIDLDDLPF